MLISDNVILSIIKNHSEHIRKYPLDTNQIIRIAKFIKFTIEKWSFNRGLSPIKNYDELIAAMCDFQISLEIAYSKYRTEHRTLWTSIFGFGASKIPQLKLPEYLNKT